MDFENQVGKIFFENEFYESILFELEKNFEQHFSKFIHFYFERIEKMKIRITGIAHFIDSKEMNKKGREIIEEREWFEIAENHDHLNLILCRFDRTGFASSIWKDSTRTEDWKRGWADEKPYKPMTPDEIRHGFQELAGFFQNQQALQNLRNKKAV
jgi:hypothetical protein